MYKFSIICFLAVFSLQSCTVSKYSNMVKGDQTNLQVQDDEEFVTAGKMIQPLARGVKSRGVITIAMIAQIASVGIKGVNKVIDKEKKKYQAEYTDAIYGMNFYSHISDKNTWDPDGIQFKEFTFIRTFIDKKGKIDTAIIATFMLDTSNLFQVYNNSVFKMVLKDIKIKYAKAKVPTTRWYMPWSYLQRNKNDKLNLDFEIEFTASYNSEQGIIHHEASLGKFFLTIRDAPLSTEASNYFEYYNNQKGKPLAGFSFIVPRSIFAMNLSP